MWKEGGHTASGHASGLSFFLYRKKKRQGAKPSGSVAARDRRAQSSSTEGTILLFIAPCQNAETTEISHCITINNDRSSIARTPAGARGRRPRGTHRLRQLHPLRTDQGHPVQTDERRGARLRASTRFHPPPRPIPPQPPTPPGVSLAHRLAHTRFATPPPAHASALTRRRSRSRPPS